MEKKKIDWNTLKWIHKRASCARGSLVVLFLVKILQGVEGVAFAFLLKAIIDCAVDKEWEPLKSNAILISLLVILAILLYWAAIYFTDRSTVKLTKAFRLRAFSQLLTRSYADIRKVHSGDWMTRINSDSTVIAGAVATIVPSTAGMIAQFTCAVISLYLLMPKVIWFLIPLGIVMLALSLFLKTRLKNYHKEVQKNEGTVFGFFQESLNSLAVIRTFTKESDMTEQAEDKLDDIVDSRMRRTRFVSVCATGIYALVRIGYLIAALICSYRLFNVMLGYGTMMAILRLVSQIDYPMAEVSHAVPQFFNMLASAERMIEIENLEPDYEGRIRSASDARDFYRKEFAYIELKDASFAYESDDGQEVLNSLDLRIDKGDYIAFTGESGCGKSTTMNILMGLYRLNSGEASVTDSSGNSSPLTPEWRSLFAYVPQENLLMSGSIREAIAFADPDGLNDDDRLWKALEAACADSFVRDLPQGLDTPLGEKGTGLSEGQMQRIAIARAIYSERPILMLDESTSALDEDTEKALLEKLKELTDRTVVIITHRPAALSICNKRIDFSKG